MPIDETLYAAVSFTTPRGTTVSRQTETITIKDTSHNVVVIPITKSWKTFASDSNYGGLYIKPTLNVYDEIMSNGGFVAGKKYLFSVDPDVVLVADNINVGAIYGDSRVPSGYEISVDLKGLALGRGGYGADYSNMDCLNNRRSLQGEPGGPAVTSVQPLTVYVYGGCSGGAGGGGNSGYYWNDDSYYDTNIHEYWYVGPKFPIDSGAGAPFGLRSEPDGTFGNLDALTHQNSHFLYDFDNAPANILFDINNQNMQRNTILNMEISAKAASVTNYSNPNLNQVLAINRAIDYPTRWFTDNQAQAIAMDWWRGYGFYRKFVEDTAIGSPRIWLYDLDKYGASQGARVPAVGYAGLFRGASAAVIGRGGATYTGWSAAYLCSSQAYVDARKDRLRGSRGGDLGKPGENGPMPMAITSHAGRLNGGGGNSSGFENLDGIQGWNRKTNSANTSTTIEVDPGNGGWNGVSFSGAVTITQMPGGALGGDEVLNKYDPAGDFDWNARGGSNYGKTFKGRYYLRG